MRAPWWGPLGLASWAPALSSGWDLGSGPDCTDVSSGRTAWERGSPSGSSLGSGWLARSSWPPQNPASGSDRGRAGRPCAGVPACPPGCRTLRRAGWRAPLPPPPPDRRPGPRRRSRDRPRASGTARPCRTPPAPGSGVSARRRWRPPRRQRRRPARPGSATSATGRPAASAVVPAQRRAASAATRTPTAPRPGTRRPVPENTAMTQATGAGRGLVSRARNPLQAVVGGLQTVSASSRSRVAQELVKVTVVPAHGARSSTPCRDDMAREVCRCTAAVLIPSICAVCVVDRPA